MSDRPPHRHISSCRECDFYSAEWFACNLTDEDITGADLNCEEGDCPYCDYSEDNLVDENCSCICHTQRVHPDCLFRKGAITFSLKLEET